MEAPEQKKKKNDPKLMENVDFGRLEIRKYIDSELEQVDEDLYAGLYNLCFIVLTR